jgi:hypothetical protein
MNLPNGSTIIKDDELTSEEKGCEKFCKLNYPENWKALYALFANDPRKFTFGIGDNRPTPIGKRVEGSMILGVSLGYESGIDRITEAPTYTRVVFDIDLTTLN